MQHKLHFMWPYKLTASRILNAYQEKATLAPLHVALQARILNAYQEKATLAPLHVALQANSI